MIKNALTILVIFISFALLIGAKCGITGGDIAQSVNDSINFLIPKGGHYSSPRLNQTHQGVTKITYYIQFEQNCKYKLTTKDSNDINKAYGFSFGNHQLNSTRLGWNWKSDTLMLYNYSYFGGQRVSRRIGTYRLSSPIYVEQKLSKDTSWISLVQNGVGKSIFVVGMGITPTSGYILYPYFGGTSVAPNAMNIKIWGVKFQN